MDQDSPTRRKTIGFAARILVPIVILCCTMVVRSHVLYEFDGTFDASGITIDIDNTANICLCDITTAGCDLNCQCDPDCPSNTEDFRSDYGFNFVGSSVDVTSQCYSTESVKMFKVNTKPSMLSTSSSLTGFVCIDASSPVQDGEKVKLSAYNQTYAASVERELASKNSTSLVTSFISSLNLTSSVLGYKYNDPLRISYSGTNAIYATISRNGASCNTLPNVARSPMIPIFGAPTTYSCFIIPTTSSCSVATFTGYEVYKNFLNLTVSKTNQTTGATKLNFDPLTLTASVSGTSCTVNEGIKYTIMYHYDSNSLGFVIDAVYGQLLPTVTLDTSKGEVMIFKAIIEYVDLDIKNYWTKSTSSPSIIPKDIAAVLESLFSVEI